MAVSIIISTYNRPQALQRVLEAVFRQNQAVRDIVIADDGSTQSTAAMITALRASAPCPLQHVWQSDQGFRAAMARNRAVAEASGDYLVFLDGDCIPFPDFIAWHEKLACPGYFVAGNRILLSREFTRSIEANTEFVWQWNILRWISARVRGQINRFLPLLKRSANGKWRDKSPEQWEGVKTCNLGLWKSDFLRVNGFDESYQGWGHEDADLAIRLIKSGIRRRDGRFAAPVLHLWHQENDRAQETENRKRLESRILMTEQLLRSKQGVDQYLK